MVPWTRITLGVLTAVGGVTALAGGATLVWGSLSVSRVDWATPPETMLVGSPFSSYLVPGLLLALVIGGTQITAAAMLLRRARGAALATAVAGYGLLIWIFVQMIVIPFSPLQAIYFAWGAAEVGLLLVALGLFRRPAADARERWAAARR
ncbi:hypothetical protein [Sinomonas atrocyanea]|uniref:hypothetical protein n=1 Tax=Sinomonas atrocyanea TaxID=37927 RepID=UPI003D964C8A